MPLSGMASSCSLTALTTAPAAPPPANASSRSKPATSSRTGNISVNQPDRARQIRTRHHPLLPAVALQPHQRRGLAHPNATSPPPAPAPQANRH